MSFIPEIQNKISTTSFNSRTAATLASSAVFQGVGEDVSKYGRVGISVNSDNATDGTLLIEESPDNINWIGIPRAWSNTSIAEPHMWNIIEPYFRIKYTNGTTEATNLHITVQYSVNADTVLAHQLDGALIDETESNVVRAVSVSKDDAGNYSNIGSVTAYNRTSQYTCAGFSDTQTMHLDVGTSSTEIAYMLVDLSDTTNWKHTNTGEIIIEYILMDVDPDTNWIGEIKIGYLSNVDGTDGDFNQIIDIDMARKSAVVDKNVEFGSHGLHCGDSSHFGPMLLNSTLFQTDVNLGGPDDPATLTYPSGNGDLVMIIDGDGTNTVDVSITIGYETIV